MKVALLICILLTSLAQADSEWVKKLKLPKDFKITKVIEAKGARQMTLAPNGTMYVGTMDQGVVYSISPDGKVTELFKELNMPQGVLWENGELYVAEVHKVSKTKDLKNLTVIKDFPNKKWHGWKTIAKGPDGKLYVPVGAPCNVCEEPLPYMAIHRMDFDGKNLETVAQGIRNTVGFTWHPETKNLWFTEMGRDQMGDNIPPDEINTITRKGEHFGFPYFHGSKTTDPKYFANYKKGLVVTGPMHEIQAHSAPIGIAFFPKDKYPVEFHDCFLVAEHGSWNRSAKSGYQVSKGCLKDGKVAKYEPFITGFKEDQKTIARPVHFLFLADGTFYLSEDEPGTILHFQYKDLTN